MTSATNVGYRNSKRAFKEKILEHVECAKICFQMHLIMELGVVGGYWNALELHVREDKGRFTREDPNVSILVASFFKNQTLGNRGCISPTAIFLHCETKEYPSQCKRTIRYGRPCKRYPPARASQ